MPYNSSDTIKDNLEHDIDLDFSPLKRQVELNCDLTTPDNDTRNKILSLLLLAAACSNSF